MPWTIYTFGDGDLIAQLLQAVALLVNGGMGSLIRAAALAGLIAVLAMAAAGMIDWSRIVAWFFGFLMIFTGLVQLRTPVAVEDVVDTRIPPQVIGDVPYLFAIPAAVSSEISYRLSLLATALQLNGEMGNGMQVMRPTANVQALLEANLAPGDLRANLVNYLHHCVVPNGSGISAQAAANRQDLFNAIASSDYFTRLPVIAGGEEAAVLPCADFYRQILTPVLQPLQPAFDAGLTQTVTALSCRVTGGRALVTAGSAQACVNPPPPWEELNASLQALQLGGLTPTNAEQTLTTVLIAKLWPEAELDLARERMDPAAALAIANDGLLKQLEIQAKTGQETAKSGLLRQIRAIADGFVYLGSPILLAIAVTPFIWKAFGLYLRLFVWLALWGPIQVIANFVIMGVAVSDITAKTAVAGAGSAVTMGNLHDAFVQIVQANAIGADVMLAVPGIALALAWGGVGALGGALGGAGGGVLATGQDVWRRVESGGEVPLSSMSKAQVEYGQINRPALSSTVSTADWRDGWSSSVVTQGLQGTTTRFADGRTVTTMRDGSSKVVSPTQEISITPQGNKSGWQVLDQPLTVRSNGDSYTLRQGASIRWTGNGAEADLPAMADPATGQTVKPRGIFAQDPNAPLGLGALTQKTWSVTQKGLTYEAVQGPDGYTFYRVHGRTDLDVLGRDGKMHSVTANIDASTVLDPKSNWQSGGFISDTVQGTAEYLTPDGERRTEQGRFWLPGQIMNGRAWQDRVGRHVQDGNNPIIKAWQDNPNATRGGYAFFMPYSGEASSVISSRGQQSITVNGVSGTMAIETLSGPDGSNASKLRVQLQDGRNIELTVPSNQQPDANGQVTSTAQVSGVIKGVTLSGGGADGKKVDLPIHTNATLTLPANPSQWTPETIGRALSAAHVTPFKAHVVDPDNPQRTMQISVNELSPPSSSGQTLSTALSAQGSGSTGVAQGWDVQRRDGWVASVSSSQSETTAPTILGTGDNRLPGYFEVTGETDVKGTMLTGHRVLLAHVQPNGERIPLGYGDVSAKLGADGRWEAVSVKTQEGVNVAQGGAVAVRRTEQVAPGVFGETAGTIDLSSGQWVQRTVQIGVTAGNLEAVRKAYPAGPVSFQPGGTLELANDGQAVYQGPATAAITTRDSAGKEKTASVLVQARLSGTYDSRTGNITFRDGSVSQVMKGDATTAGLPQAGHEFLQKEIGQAGVAQVQLDESGRALRVKIEGGDTTSAQRNVFESKRNVFGRTQDHYDIQPQTAYNLARSGDRTLANDVLQAPSPQQQSVALAQANALAKYMSELYTRQGQSGGTSGVGLSLSGAKLAELLSSKLKGGLPENVQGPLEAAMQMVQGNVGWRSGDSQVVNLVTREFLSNYYEADGAAAQAARKAPNDPRAYQRTFERVYTKLNQQSIKKIEDTVNELGPAQFGATALPARLGAKAGAGMGGLAQSVFALSNLMGGGSPGAASNGQSAGPSSSANAAMPAAPPTPPPSVPASPAGRDRNRVAEARSLLDRHPAVRGALAASLDQYKRGVFDEPVFREQVRSAFTELYAEPYRRNGTRVPDTLKTKIDQATEEVVAEARRVREHEVRKTTAPPVSDRPTAR